MSFLESMIRTVTNRASCKQKAMATFRPRLEALESRLAPAISTWEGDVSVDWADKKNWVDDRLPAPVDTAVLKWTQGLTQFSPEVKAAASMVVRDIDLDNSFTGNGKHLTINGKLILGLDQGLTEWDQAADIKGSGLLGIQNGGFRWSKGNIEVSNLYVYGVGQFFVTKDAKNLLVDNLYIGKRPGVIGESTLLLGTVTIGGNNDLALNDNLTLKSDTTIHIEERGTLQFSQQSGSSSKGGINQSTSQFPTSQIRNEGLIKRPVRDQQDEVLYVGIPIWNMSQIAKVSLAAGASMRVDDTAGCDPSILLTEGEIEMEEGARLELADRLRIEGGLLRMKAQQAGTTTTIMGSVIMTGGRWIVGNDVNPLRAHIIGPLSISGKSILQIAVDCSTVNQGDWIEVDGTFSLTKDQTGIYI